MRRTAPALTVLLLLVTACGGEATAPDEAEAVEQGGEASGDVQEGSISDAMIPLEALRSQSPSLRRQTTTVTTTEDGQGGSQTTVETTTTVNTSSAPAPAAPQPPTPPRG